MDQKAEIKKTTLFKRIGGWMGITIFVLLVLTGWLTHKVVGLSEQYVALHEEVAKSREANERVLVMLTEIRDEQEKQARSLQQALQVTYDKRLQKNNIMLLKSQGYSQYTDLGAHSTISVEAMNNIIAYYEEHACHSMAFSGHGEAFIEAARITGLNPVYLFAHAACESDFGRSYLARDRHNYFGINAVDTNPNAAYAMGDGVDQGIIAGAVWIKKNYYDQGYTTLESMHNAGYATSPTWASEIVSIANSAIRVM